MSRLVVARRVLLGLIAFVVVAALVGGVVVVRAVRDSLPTHSGEATLPGLSAAVTVKRDGSGIPHIYGDSVTDLARAQGYVHAQERFFEMDLRRHITAGRLSELVGSAGVETDKVVRTMGWRRVAEEELPTLEPETRQLLQAYADGVNRYLRGRSPGQVSAEYTVLGLQLPLGDIEDWTPVDSLAWLKAMAWDLRGDYTDELARARLSGRMSRAQINAAYPAYDSAAHPPILSDAEWAPGRTAPGAGVTTNPSAVPPALTAADEDVVAETTTPGAQAAYAAVDRALAAVPQLVGHGDGVGSNSWVLSGQHTASGRPLLANDPHLGVGQPGIWIQNSLHCRTVSAECPLDVSGFSFAGVPGVIIGHNADIAWGFTNLGPDVSDFYLERIVGQTYLRDGEWEQVTTREETIKVAGGADQRITVRATTHGPIMSDVLSSAREAGARAPTQQEGDENQDYAVSLAWTGLTPSRTADAIIGLNKARTFEQFREAARSFAVPAQNLLYADRAGHIGYQAPGQIPVRRAAIAKSVPGYWPAPGWDSSYDWTGWVPFEDLPWAFDPPDGVIVAANQEVTSSRTPFLTSEWDHGWRSTRIAERLASLEKATPADMASVQMDDTDLFAKVLVPALLAVPLEGPTGEADQQDLLDFTEDARDLLRGWNFSTPASDSDASAAAAYYNAVWRNLCELLFDDELPADMKADGGDRWRAAVQALLKDPQSEWWDDKLTPNVTEGRDEILRQALVQARLELTKELGKDPQEWDWGKLHRITLEHKVLGGDSVPGPVRWLFNEGPYDMPGGSAIVNANGWDASQGYEVDWGPSMRMVVDLSDLDGSTWVNQTGVSGHATDDHYADQISDWVAGRQRPWPFSAAAVDDTDPDVMTLRPDPVSGTG
ncbi:penicillin acylase family protein [Phycicoccus sonneratiae]|uniref:Penicillin acylase family protein n=1 Tax=Phycicoccus sonneratiae TaxID=2807628 RepID=A0ABS2CSI8_9MICO|nr:penicillin acylase family protein [Phycicoccus sonneraticus]MBM6402131.1 penicillin acylase family protein [Phycicoccus sonneraticus]